MGEARQCAAEGLHEIQLDGGVGDVVFAANDLGDAGLQIIHRGGEEVEEPAVSADDDGVGEGGKAHRLGPGGEVVPSDGAAAQAEAPVGAAAFAL